MEITIVMLDGRSHTLMVQPQHTVGYLKTLIKDKLGVPPHEQKLVFVNGQKISLSDDSKAVSYYGLQPGSQVSLLVIQPPTMQVFINNLQGKKSTYDVKPDETVMNLKRRVECREGVKVSQQRLVYQSREMMDGDTLADYNIEALGTINLTSRLRGGSSPIKIAQLTDEGGGKIQNIKFAPMDLHIVMLGGPSQTLIVDPNITVGSLKILIQQKLGVAPHMQKLVYDNGQRTTLSDDSMPVSFYGLKSGSQLSLLVTQPPTIQVFLRNEKGQVSTYDIKPDETVSDFKTKVQCREGVQVSQQRLLHQSREMTSGKLSDYNVTEHSTIDLMFRLRGGGGHF
ncbi:ubiquitin-like protein ISG15 [Symphorus nematophorus]